MDTAIVNYKGELLCELVHLRSGQAMTTDAPVDNKGKGSAFSPTDLLATSLAACMITTMGIVAREKDIPLNGLKARVVKHMASDPRRVSRVEVHLELDGRLLDDRQRNILVHTAQTCPVARSLSTELVQEVRVNFF